MSEKQNIKFRTQCSGEFLGKYREVIEISVNDRFVFEYTCRAKERKKCAQIQDFLYSIMNKMSDVGIIRS